MANEASENREELSSESETTIIPVVREEISIGKEVVDTAKVVVRKHVTEELTSIDIPLIQEGYRIERVPVNKVVDAPPTVRKEDETTIIPVLREVLVVQKKYEIIEEVHIIKEQTTIPHSQEILLRKEEVTVQRTPLANDNQL